MATIQLTFGPAASQQEPTWPAWEEERAAMFSGLWSLFRQKRHLWRRWERFGGQADSQTKSARRTTEQGAKIRRRERTRLRATKEHGRSPIILLLGDLGAAPTDFPAFDGSSRGKWLEATNSNVELSFDAGRAHLPACQRTMMGNQLRREEAPSRLKKPRKRDDRRCPPEVACSGGGTPFKLRRLL